MSLSISHAQDQATAGVNMSNDAESSWGEGPSYDMAHVSVLDVDDMRRIRNNVANINEDVQREKAQQEDRQRLHNLSKERVSKWANTIQGQRLAKLRARDLRLAKEEKQKLELDAEEAERQAKERKEAIERARTMKYYQTDNVKGFHGAMLLTHVLNEREMQIEVKKKRANLQAEISAEWRKEKNLRQQQEEMKEILKDKAKRQRNLDTFREQRQQAAKLAQAKADVAEDIKKEEIEVSKGDAKYHEDQKKLDAEARQMARKNYLELVQANSKAKEIMAKETAEDLLQEESIRVYANAKENMIQLSKHKKQQKFADMERNRTKMRAYVLELNESHKRKRPDPHHSSKSGIFDNILEDRTDNDRKDKVNKETIASHQLMIAAKASQRNLECEENKKILKQQIRDYEQDALLSKEKNAEKMCKGIKLQEIHKHQISERRKAEAEEQIGRLKLEADVQKAVADEDKGFEEYAMGVIRDLEETPGQSKQNIQPLYNNLNEKHKKPGRRAPKDHAKPSITKQRLGLDSRSKPVQIHIPKKRGTYIPRPQRPPAY